MEWRDRIIVDPQVLAGKPIVKGTRISVELVIDLLAAGCTPQQLLDSYPTLGADDIRACLAYASEILHGEKVPSATGMKFLADENCPRAAVDALRGASFDILWIAEAKPGDTDVGVLAISVSTGRLRLSFAPSLPCTISIGFGAGL